MDFYKTLVDFIKTHDITTILKQLGYVRTSKGEKALKTFLESGSLKKWLERCHFDYVHGSETFVKKLAEIAGIDMAALEKKIERLNDRRSTLYKLSNPYIFADTHFKRQSEPIFALTMLDGRRRIGLDKEWVYDHTLDETLEKVSEAIETHYRQTEGKIPLFGKIREYFYHHINERAFHFDTKGRLLGEVEEAGEEGRARLYVGGKEIPESFFKRVSSKESR